MGVAASHYQHFLDLKDVPKETLRHILDTAKLWKNRREGMSKGAVDEGAPLSGKTLAMVFEKSSTRTRISFEMAMQQLGGSSIILQGSSMQLGRGETIADTARVMSRYVDAIMLRANTHAAVEELAEEGEVPVINALTDRSHPCQLMADVLTLEEHLGPVQGKKIAWVGDGNNVATSLIEAAVQFDFSLTLGCPDNLMPETDVLNWAKAAGGDVRVVDNASDAVGGANAVFTDTWISMGDDRTGAKLKALEPFQVNDSLMAKAHNDAIFLHCLPAHRGEEVTNSVIDGPQSVVWDEAENRLHAQKAILAWCLGVI
ncbi:ornithine carbamoyltransferase [Kordiimonas sp. SCSIO 12610]|uniref:ornithine carbamoyltransferase n=1 Tax=Kordiimonas sp. SCSIO 12610 TaxID=2829597 RepID=UPI00210CEA43|nr:ornithine carbamoyltransferase [Kordiimonas sp. SCSIO 12610]UTW55320.1 ornithine carbamoyltransferase [Kordiimonas sp. SCSIO 12610]